MLWSARRFGWVSLRAAEVPPALRSVYTMGCRLKLRQWPRDRDLRQGRALDRSVALAAPSALREAGAGLSHRAAFPDTASGAAIRAAGPRGAASVNTGGAR